ncbi:MAG TPA: nuclear transport factor 2 family protein [Gemmatimonadaceae bacterium]|jgi:Ketosteroid isomerase homolog
MRAFALLALVTIVSGMGCSGSDDAASEGSLSTPSAQQQPAANADAGQVRQAIETASARFSDAARRGDAAGLVATYAENAVVMQPNTPAWRGRDAIRKGWAGFLSSATVREFSLHTEDVMTSGDLAVQTGTYSMTLQPKTAGARELTDKGKFVVAWRKQADGSWKAVRDIYNSDMPPGGS